MLFKRAGYPEEGEFVLCTVTTVQHHSVFCNLDEYTESGMIHISEVSPGRIRNIRDYVKEGKKVVCLVLNVNKEKGYIDLSLRRVNDAQKRRKQDSIKQEQKAEKIVELLANEIKQPFKDLYKTVSDVILKEYDFLHLAFNEVVEEDLKLSTLGLDKKLAEQLQKIIKEKIMLKEVCISGEFKISIYDSDGLETIKTALDTVEKMSDQIGVKYEGGGRYSIQVNAKEYKEAEKILKEAKDALIGVVESKNGVATFERNEK